jgi:hypothetical protein
LVWAGIAAILLLAGKVVYLMFWSLFGLLLILFWLGHMVYKVFYLFNPDFKPIKVVFIFLILLFVGLSFFKIVLAPSWNVWGSTEAEIEAEYEVDNYCPEYDIRTVRTIEANVPKEYLYRWIRQLPKVGSYGWDLLNFIGRKNFDRLISDIPEPQLGDNFLIGQIVELDPGESITFDIGVDPKFPKLGINCMYGGYYLKDAGRGRTRMIMVMRADYEGFWGWLYSQLIIEFGDFFIATAELKNLRKAAEENYRSYN